MTRKTIAPPEQATLLPIDIKDSMSQPDTREEAGAQNRGSAELHRFQDEIHGNLFLTSLERDIVDTPEYRRLFRVAQLGFIRLVFQTANHTRGEHGIGACWLANSLIEHLNKNNENANSDAPRISEAETTLIRLGALIHDLPHGPYSHDIEGKKHIHFVDGQEIPTKSAYGSYPKHDNYSTNPTFFLMVMDPAKSVLARVLRHHSPAFHQQLVKDASAHAHLADFVKILEESSWTNKEAEILPSLLFHLFAFEDPKDAESHTIQLSRGFDRRGEPVAATEWSLVPTNDAVSKKLHQSWFQPYRHDIIGNTLSADLLDYVHRDLRRLGLNRGLDLRLLHHYILAAEGGSSAARPRYRCVIDLDDKKRRTIRGELLNDIFRLLDLRQEIHEKAVGHRVVQSAAAMMARCLMLLGEDRPSLGDLSGVGTSRVALTGDDGFLKDLIAKSETGHADDRCRRSAYSLAVKLSERRVYRPLMIVPGDRAVRLVVGGNEVSAEQRDPILRKLGAVVDSRRFQPFFLFMSTCVEKFLQHAFASPQELSEYIEGLSMARASSSRITDAMQTLPGRVIIWAPPYKQLYKDPALRVQAEAETYRLDEVEDAAKSISQGSFYRRVTDAIHDAGSRYAAMWKLYVFISDGLFYRGVLPKLLRDHPCWTDLESHKQCLETAKDFLGSAFVAANSFYTRSLENEPLDLNQVMSPKEFVRLLKFYVGERQASVEGKIRNISIVDAEYYLHGDDLEKCRDIRYKYDGPVDVAGLSESDKELVEELLEQLELQPSAFRGAEYVEIARQLRSSKNNVLQELQRASEQPAAARHRPLELAPVRRAWLDDLPIDPAWTHD